jgi:8-oxo-dGTP pyrophosphatase MutT (NUDIX family)
MAKKYKVFEDGKCIIIQKETESTDHQAEIIKYFSEKQLPSSIDAFLASEKNTLVIIHKEPEKVFEAFKKLYLFIEAAGGVVYNSKKEILFIFRKNKWDLPKGKIDKGEKRREAAIREVEEECGIKGLKIKEKLLNTYHVYMLNGKKVLKKSCWFEMKTDFKGKLIPQLNEDITRAEWMDKKQIKEALKNTYPAIEEVCIAAGII